MPATRFKIVFEGHLQPGYTLAAAKNNLATLFNGDTDTIDTLFSGHTVSLKRDLSYEAAEKYLAALSDAGIQARIEQELETQLSLDLLTISPHRANAHESQPSPYSPPEEAVEPRGPSYYGPLKVMSFKGRIARLRYMAWSLAITLPVILAGAVAALIFPLSATLGYSIVAIAAAGMIVTSQQITAQRLHDMGWSGWLAPLQLIPGISSIFALFLAVVPGNQEPNQYGAPPPPNSRAVKFICGLWVAVILLAILGLALGGAAHLAGEMSHVPAA